MQNISVAESVAAVRMLERALPGAAGVERVHAAPDSRTVRIRPPSADPIEVSLTSSVDAPVPDSVVRLVVVDGSATRHHDALRRAGQSFIDLSGVVHLQTPGLYIDRTDLGRAKVQTAKSSRVDPYSDRASGVARVLLTSPRARRWTTSGLAEAADVDVSTASRVVRELQRRELVVDEAPGQGRASRIRLTDPMALLGDWTRRYSWDDNTHLRVAAPIGSLVRFLPRLGDHLAGLRWALSLQAGASLVAPHADFEIVHVYVDGAVEAIAAERGWQASPSGRLVLMQAIYPESVWFQQQELAGANVVSCIQLVLDLWHYPVRGREQAEHLVETVLRPLWDRDAES